METKLYTEDIGICLENIRSVGARSDALRACLHAHIHELARAVLAGCAEDRRASAAQGIPGYPGYSSAREEGDTSPLSAEELLRAYRRSCPFSSAFAGTDREKSAAYARSDLLACRLLLCRELYSLLSPSELEQLMPDGMLGAVISPATGLSVAYLQNSYSDRAFESLAPSLCGTQNSEFYPSRVLCDDLSSVCDAVDSGRVPYGILPFEDLSEGRLGGVRKLLLGYDLKIAHTAVLREKGLVFALIRKSISRMERLKSGPVHYEFTVHSGNAVGELLSAAEQLGFSVYRLDSIPSYSGGEFLCDIVLTHDAEGTEQALSVFILYLMLEAPDFSSAGIYCRADCA